MRETIDTKRALELRESMTWQEVADTLSRECNRWPPFKSKSVAEAIRKEKRHED